MKKLCIQGIIKYIISLKYIVSDFVCSIKHSPAGSTEHKMIVCLNFAVVLSCPTMATENILN